jgi:hypothetical protein
MVAPTTGGISMTRRYGSHSRDRDEYGRSSRSRYDDDGRGWNARSQPRDEYGRFETEDEYEREHGGRFGRHRDDDERFGRSGAQFRPRDEYGRFEPEDDDRFRRSVRNREDDDDHRRSSAQFRPRDEYGRFEAERDDDDRFRRFREDDDRFSRWNRGEGRGWGSPMSSGRDWDEDERGRGRSFHRDERRSEDDRFGRNHR